MFEPGERVRVNDSCLNCNRETVRSVPVPESVYSEIARLRVVGITANPQWHAAKQTWYVKVQE